MGGCTATGAKLAERRPNTLYAGTGAGYGGRMYFPANTTFYVLQVQPLSSH